MNESESTTEAENFQDPHTLLGSVISERYRIDTLLGEGGMGAVYSAEHLHMRKRVAVKVLHPEMTRMPEIVARFEREAMAAAHMEDPHVVAATDFGKLPNGAFFLVLEYVEGRNLREEVNAGPMPLGRAVNITQQILTALIRAHALGIVHRDLKPENVMLVDRDGDPDFVKVLDFGIAKVPVSEITKSSGHAPTAALTQLGMIYGTPEYMAPEQALGQDVDHRADLYALGVILFEMLTGLRPFDAPNKVQILGMVISMPVPSLASILPGRVFPEALETFVHTLLAKLPTDRFSDARSTFDALDLIAAGLPLSPVGSTSMRRLSLVNARRSFVDGALSVAVTGMPSLVGETFRSGSLPESRVVPSGLKRWWPLPIPLLLGTSGALLIAVVTIIIFSLKQHETPLHAGVVASASGVTSAAGMNPVPPAIATDEELRSAVSEGVPGLEALRTRMPNDKRVLRALAKAQIGAKQASKAVAIYETLLVLDPSLTEERDVRDGLLGAAQTDDSDDAAFSLMESKLGAAGADLLYDFATSAGVPAKVAKRALQTLLQPSVRANASGALKVVLDLRAVQGCERKKVLGDAKTNGDVRALAYLVPLTANTGCGFLRRGDCYRCFRGDGSLNEAIRAIQSRKKATSP